MRECPKDPALQPGTWKPWMNGKIFLACPKCGQIGLLDHEVASDGMITPSVQCPKDGCFHDNVKLVGWEPEKGIK